MKTLLKLNEEYTTLHKELTTTLQEFSEWISGFPERYSLRDDVYHEWSMNYDETVKQWWIDKDKVHIHLEYTDSYDGYDTSSHLLVPYKWVAAFHNGNKEIVEGEILQGFKYYQQKQLDMERENVKMRAIELGLLSE